MCVRPRHSARGVARGELTRFAATALVGGSEVDLLLWEFAMNEGASLPTLHAARCTLHAAHARETVVQK